MRPTSLLTSTQGNSPIFSQPKLLHYDLKEVLSTSYLTKKLKNMAIESLFGGKNTRKPHG